MNSWLLLAAAAWLLTRRRAPDKLTFLDGGILPAQPTAMTPTRAQALEQLEGIRRRLLRQGVAASHCAMLVEPLREALAIEPTSGDG